MNDGKEGVSAKRGRIWLQTETGMAAAPSVYQIAPQLLAVLKALVYWWRFPEDDEAVNQYYYAKRLIAEAEGTHTDTENSENGK